MPGARADAVALQMFTVAWSGGAGLHDMAVNDQIIIRQSLRAAVTGCCMFP